jgi:hypothetical protein
MFLSEYMSHSEALSCFDSLLLYLESLLPCLPSLRVHPYIYALCPEKLVSVYGAVTMSWEHVVMSWEPVTMS